MAASFLWLSSILGIIFLIILIVLVGLISEKICKFGEEIMPLPRSKQPTSAARSTRHRTLSTPIIKDIQLTMCPKCQATILAEASVCPHCNTPRPTCMVCHHPLQINDSLLLCPYCKGEAHRIHILEYIKVKGTCPNCQTKLEPSELIEQQFGIPQED